MTAENFDMEELLQYVEERKFRLLRSRLAEMNEADIAEFMEELDDNKKVLIFRMLPKDQAAAHGGPQRVRRHCMAHARP